MRGCPSTSLIVTAYHPVPVDGLVAVGPTGVEGMAEQGRSRISTHRCHFHLGGLSEASGELLTVLSDLHPIITDVFVVDH